MRSTHVSNNQVVDDGYNLADVENAIKVIPMQNYLGSTETDVTKLFQMLIDNAEGKLPIIETPQVEIEAKDIIPGNVVIKKPKGRPKKK